MAAVLSLSATSTAVAQQQLPAVGVTTRNRSPASLPLASLPHLSSAGAPATPAHVWVEEGRGGRVLKHTAIGTLVGVAAAVLVVFVHTRTGDYTDHSLDRTAYFVAVPVGAGTGAVVGTIVGLVRTR
jgi:hypothetical protein